MSPCDFFLGKESLNPPPAIGRHPRGRVHVRGEIDRIEKIHAVEFRKHLFAERHGRGAVLCQEFADEAFDGAVKRLLRDDDRCKAGSLRLLGVEDRAAEHEVARAPPPPS